MQPILQSRLTTTPWTNPALWRLPGIVPMSLDDWLEVDDAYAAQMAERARLMASAEVHALDERARPAAEELYDLILTRLPGLGFRLGATEALRPDGVSVALDRGAPLLTLGQLVQEDLCLMEKRGDEHVLTGAILCFPASWLLAEKFLAPMTGIHAPVAVYDETLARRVQRLFDAIRVDQPLYRMNALLYADPTLHQPQSQSYRRPREGERRYLRSERQGLVKLPQTGAVVFSIHTHVVSASILSAEDIATLVAGGH